MIHVTCYMLHVQKGIPLAPLTTFKIGGLAKFFVITKTLKELQEAVAWAKDHDEKIFVLGGGANILIADEGLQGLVVRVISTDFEIVKKEGSLAEVRAGAGLTFGQLVTKAAQADLGGLDFLGGLPGSLGGGVYGNAGWTDRAIGDFVESVTVVDIATGEIKKVTPGECEFTYRGSKFKKWPVIIWEAVLSLPVLEKNQAMQAIADNTKKKLASQPTIFPCAGCVFQNVRLTEQPGNAKLRKLLEDEKRAGSLKQVDPEILPSSWLIDRAGLKGKTIGGAQVSDKHANFIVNTGAATAADVIMLMSLIKQQVRDQFGVQLREEVQLLGF